MGSVDFDLLVLGRGMARDGTNARDLRRGGRGMVRDQAGESLSKLQQWAHERMNPDDCARLDELVQSVMKDHRNMVDKREQKALTEFLQKRGFSPGDIERARDLIVADAEMPNVGRGQQGLEIGPAQWWETRGRDADPPPQHEVETTRDDYDEEGYPAGRAPPHGPFDEPEAWEREGMEPREPRDVPMGLDPPKAQDDDDEWIGSNRPPPRRAPPREEPEDSEEDRQLKNILARFSRLDSGQIERAVELQRAGRLKQPRESSGSLDEPPDFPGKPRPGSTMVEMAGDRALSSFERMYPGAPPPTCRSPRSSVFVR
jgi:hypothetical protein